MATKKRIFSVIALSLMFMIMISAASSVGISFANAAAPATFGNTVVGPYTDRTPIGDKDSVMYQAPETGTMTSISMFIQTGGALVRYAVYTDLNGQPDQLIAQSRIVRTTENSWVTAPISAPIVAGQNYWLTVASNSMIYWNYDFGALAGNGKQFTAISSPTYGEFVPWGTAKFSMYATYTPADSAAAPAEVVLPAPAQTSPSAPEPVAVAPVVTAPEPTPAAAQPASAQAAPATTSNMPAGLSLKVQTDFETATKASASSLANIGFGNYFEFGGSGGASMWVEGLDRTTSGITAHSGSRALGLDVTDISQSRRSEFNVYKDAVGLGDRFYTSMYIYLPSSFTVKGGDGAYYDLFQASSDTGTACPLYSLMIGKENSDGTFGIQLFARDASASKMGNDGIISSISNFNLPRGQWFKLEWYQVNSADGVIQAWINGQQIVNYYGYAEMTGNYYLSTDIYYNADDTSTHQMWIDDFAIYG